MVPVPDHDVTRLLAALNAGDERAAEQLLPFIQQELHAIAASYMRRQPKNHTLQTTALVNEAFLRLIGGEQTDWQNRAHYLRVAAKAMRCVLVDHARRRAAVKRGGGLNAVPLDAGAAFSADAPLDFLALDEALTRLAASYPTEARIVELRFFGGLSVEETARVLDVSTATVKRNWRMAKAWLKRELSGSDDRGE